MYPHLGISLRQIQYLVAVADLGGFRRAALACHVSQPALSAQVALAERALGVRIFERDRRRVRLSAAGERILEPARRILVAAGDMNDLARRLADPFQGTLKLGVIPTIGPYLLPDITPVISRTWPRLTIVWTEGRTAELVDHLRAGRLDGVLLALEADIGDLDHAPLGRDPFVLAASPTHPLVRPSKAATPDMLDGVTVLLLDDGHCFREQALRVCSRAGAGEMSFRATSLGTLVQMVSTGASVTLLPSLALPVENRRGQLRIRRFKSPGPGRTLALAWRKGSAPGVALAAMARVLKPILKRAGSPSS